MADMESTNLTVDDAGNTPLRVGNTVQTLSIQYIKKSIPPSAKDADALRLADKIATIHEIFGNKIYIEILAEHCVTRIRAEAVLFKDEGLTVVMGDGRFGRVGSLVQVLFHEEDVSNLVGNYGWVHGMGDACGRTGKIVRILENFDVLVQFPWGPRYYFRPEALLKSSSVKLETQDHRNNWIEVGSLVQVKKSPREFAMIQKKNHLQYLDTYSELPSKYATVKSIRLTAFSTAKTVKILYQENSYLVNIECLELVDSIKDRWGRAVRPDDLVQVISDEGQLKLLQEDKPGFGGWVDGMSKVVGRMGRVIRLCYNEKSTFNSLKVQVQFEDLNCFYFNPMGIELLLDPETKLIEATTVNNGSNKLEKIDRSYLKCREILGSGSFGCVFRGEWTTDGGTRAVAIKQIHDRITRSVEATATGTCTGTNSVGGLLESAKNQFSLKHPNILQFIGISLENDLWIVTDLLDGTDLYTLLFSKNENLNNNPPKYKQKVMMTLDMSSAIAYIHQKRYIHCDIKPQNMMVDKKTGKLYICDSATSRLVGNMDLMEFATEFTHSIAETLYYTAPECLRKNQANNKCRKPSSSADIWSLGAVLYELFTEKRLLNSPIELLENKRNNKDASVKLQLPNLPEQLLSIVSKALEFNHCSRPSAQIIFEFFHELQSSNQNDLIN